MTNAERVPNTGLFLETARTMVDALTNPTIAEKWDETSALKGYTVGGLVGHLSRTIRTVLAYLDQPEPTGKPITPAQYFLDGLGDEDPIDSGLHLSIRRRAQSNAAKGPEDNYRQAAADYASVTERLAATEDRNVEVFGGAVMRLSDYLVTRFVEIVVHLDDLEHSIGTELPKPPGPAIDLTLATLFEMAVVKDGPYNMLRALSRVERVESFPRAF